MSNENIDLEQTYQSTLAYLYSFVDFSLMHQSSVSPDQFNLDRMREFARLLGDPQKAYPVLHVAGTKGKGSVSALCASALQTAGYSVGLYTSPHLDDFAERIQVNGQPISHSELIQLVNELKPIIEQIPQLSTFEIATGLAFLYFARREVDAAVVEVGLGGRLDATNIVTPIVSVITSISYDHTQLLGNTLAEIALEKAGIIKPGRPVVLAPQPLEAYLAVEHTAHQRSSPLYRVGKDYLFTPLRHSLQEQSLIIWPAIGGAQPEAAYTAEAEQNQEPVKLTIPLLGLHQVENAATAYVALQVAAQVGLFISDEEIVKGFRQVEWPGRFEILQRNPFLVLDSAHNRDSALRLRQTLDEYFPGNPTLMIFGASEDKDIAGMFAELLPRIQRLVLVKSFHPRAADPEKLADLARQYGCPVKIIPDVAEALLETLSQADPGDIVLVAGSIFVAAGARIAWTKQYGA
ncbi:MAG: bifunctional folylpolyglutamate synthase/dihydrofolate synthase [Anaerolineales bacterium]|jgi:dihydrofolate synthase/folylpolyglutamate synthase|nr:bifunctional folylpolyglutamate synthase/dihydrofolate synthase [Anaerolineales bacterium]